MNRYVTFVGKKIQGERVYEKTFKNKAQHFFWFKV